MDWKFFLAGVFGFLVCYLGCLGALKWFPKLGLMDRPELYGLKRKPIPYFGGIVMILSFLLSVLIFVPISQKVLVMIVGIIGLGVVSFLDDKFRVSPKLRLLLQILCGILLFSFGISVDVLNNPFGGAILIGDFGWWLVLGLTVVWVVAMINTMNFLDGLNGLSSGVGASASLVVFLLSLRPEVHLIDQTEVAMLAVILFGVCLAFFRFDFYPAKILMGDTGSVFLGFLLAVLAIFSGGKLATAVLVMGFPILDALWVVLRRIFNGKSPFKGDLEHLHHRLLYAGFSERGAILFICSTCLLFGGLALVLGTMEKLLAISILILAMIIVGFLVAKRRKI